MKESYSPLWSKDSVRHIHNASRVLRERVLTVQEAGSFATFPGYFTEREKLPSFLLIATVSGEGKLSYENHVYTLSPQTTCLIDCMQAHRYWAAVPWDFLWVHFNGPSAADYARLAAVDPNPVAAVETAATLQEILTAAGTGTFEGDLTCNELLTRVLTEIILEKRKGGEEGGGLPDLVSAAERYIDRRFTEDLSLAALASAVGASESYLCHLYRRWTGRTIMESVRQRRLGLAKELLRTTDLSVGEVADRCGRSHVSHFIEDFRRAEGMTPLSYRRLWQERGPEEL